MPKLDAEHAAKRMTAYGVAIHALDDLVTQYQCGEHTDRALAVEAEYLSSKLSREMTKHREKYTC